MKFSCQRSDLLNALGDACKALPAKAEKTILENISLTVNEDGILLLCSDGKMCISAGVPAQVEDGGTLLVPGHLFSDMVRKMTDEVVTFTVNERMMMNIRCGSMRANIACSDRDYPEIQDMSHVPVFHVDKAVLSDMVGRVAFSVATLDSRPQLTGIFVEVTREELRVVALDGFRMALQVKPQELILPEGKDKLTAIVPGRVMTTLCSIMDGSSENMVSLRITADNISAFIGGTEMVASLLGGQYINYRQIIPAQWNTVVTVKRKDLQEAVSRASLIAQEGKNNLIKMEIGSGILRITSNSEIGDDLEEIEAGIVGEEIKIAFNARYVAEILSHIEDENVKLKMINHVSPCVVTPVEGDAYLYLLLPVRVYN